MATGRNRYVIEIEVEFDQPLTSTEARACGELLARDFSEWLKSNHWGWGRAQIENVYSPARQFEHGDFVPS
jgi:hypothetical protein